MSDVTKLRPADVRKILTEYIFNRNFYVRKWKVKNCYIQNVLLTVLVEAIDLLCYRNPTDDFKYYNWMFNSDGDDVPIIRPDLSCFFRSQSYSISFLFCSLISTLNYAYAIIHQYSERQLNTRLSRDSHCFSAFRSLLKLQLVYRVEMCSYKTQTFPIVEINGNRM